METHSTPLHAQMVTAVNDGGVIPTDSPSVASLQPDSTKAPIHINPPPSHGRCYRCRRHVSELTQYGGPGNPCVGDFTGARLVKTFRNTLEGLNPLRHIVADVPRIIQQMTFDPDWEDIVDALNDKYGKADVDYALRYHDLQFNSFEASWECRDCIVQPSPGDVEDEEDPMASLNIEPDDYTPDDEEHAD